jgi:hypothetical protein
MEPSDVWAQECLASTILEQLESQLRQAPQYRQEVADLIRLSYRQAAALSASLSTLEGLLPK